MNWEALNTACSNRMAEHFARTSTANQIPVLKSINRVSERMLRELSVNVWRYEVIEFISRLALRLSNPTVRALRISIAEETNNLAIRNTVKVSRTLNFTVISMFIEGGTSKTIGKFFTVMDVARERITYVVDKFITLFGTLFFELCGALRKGGRGQ
jgi:hypothetical protein